MDLIVDTAPISPRLRGWWTVHVPFGEPDPWVCRGEDWLGQGSTQTALGLDFRVGEGQVLRAEGVPIWYNVRGVGKVILLVTPPTDKLFGKWEMAMGLLEVWLIHVFEDDIRLVYLGGEPAATIPRARPRRYV